MEKCKSQEKLTETGHTDNADKIVQALDPEKTESFSVKDVIRMAKKARIPFGNLKKNIEMLSKEADCAASESGDPNFDKRDYMNKRLAAMRGSQK